MASATNIMRPLPIPPRVDVRAGIPPRPIPDTRPRFVMQPLPAPTPVERTSGPIVSATNGARLLNG